MIERENVSVFIVPSHAESHLSSNKISIRFNLCSNVTHAEHLLIGSIVSFLSLIISVFTDKT